MAQKKTSSIKKEIFFPSIIGDWTTYTSEKNKKSISITKSVGLSNKTISEEHLEELLFFHQEFFESLFEKIAQEINSHIEIETVSINTLNHHLFKQSLKDDVYQCKFKLPNLEQIDLLFSKKATKFIAHRLCGGNTAPEGDLEPTSVEISLVNVINQQFITILSNHWNKIFLPSNTQTEATFGHYHFEPQQSESETIIELNCNFKLFGKHDLTCKIIYSLETIEKLIFYDDMLNHKIIENTFLTDDTLKNTNVDVKSIIGTTSIGLNEMQNIEIGDVILLENTPLSSPVEIIVGENVTFQGLPININDQKIGVQVTHSPQYNDVIKELGKPTEGPLISTESNEHHRDQIAESAPQMSTPSPEIEPINDLPEEATTITDPEPEETLEDDLNMPESAEPVMEQTEPPAEPITTTEPIPEESTSENVANDDFSWDDLDDE